MYLKFFTMDELKKLWIQVDKVFEPNENWKSEFKTITLNWIDIRDIIDETNITFTYNSLDKVTKEAVRWNLMQNLQYLLQYAGQSLDMQEVSKILAWLDFDPSKLFKKQQAKVEQPNMWDLSWMLWWQSTWEEQLPEETENLSWEMSDEDIMSQLQNIV